MIGRVTHSMSTSFWLVSAVLPLTSTATGEVSSVVTESLHDKGVESGSVRVIVQLRVAVPPEGQLGRGEAKASARQAIAEAQSSVLRELAGTSYRVVRAYETIPFLALEASLDALQALEGSALVMNVEEDRVESPQNKPDGSPPPYGSSTR